MAPLGEDQMTLLKKALESDFVPQLPPLVDKSKSADEQRRKSLSRI